MKIELKSTLHDLVSEIIGEYCCSRPQAELKLARALDSVLIREEILNAIEYLTKHLPPPEAVDWPNEIV